LATSLDLSSYAPEFEIFVGKQASANHDIRRSAISIQISEQVSDAAQYTLVLSDKLDITKQEFEWLDSPLLDVGNFIRIDMGYAITKLEKMIEGPIKSVSTSGFSPDIPKLTLVGYDRSHQHLTEKSTSEKTVKPENKDTYSKIAERIAIEAGLEPVIDQTKEYSSTLTKKPVTYNEFLGDAAKRVGFEFFVARGKLFFVNPSDPKKKPSPFMSFEWGKDLMQFSPTINTSELVTGVEVRGSLPNSKQKIVAVAKSGEEAAFEKGVTASQLAEKLSNGKENIRTIEDRTFSSKEEAEDMAKAELERAGRNLVTGSATIVGNPRLLPGMTVEFKKLGKRFSGMYYVTAVTNTIDDKGYTTKFDVRRNVIGMA
jgi:phage protein D